MKEFIKNIIKNKDSKGVKAFTLVETLVSTLIISLVILGPLTVAINASTYARQTKDIMIGTYLAQEATELLHHLQDSIYLKCVADSSSTNTVCQSQADANGIYEIPRETSWRVFKSYLTSGISCFGVSGCTYDFINMTENEDIAPTKYLPTDNLCNSFSTTSDFLYVCTGAHGAGGTLTSFKRSVFLELIPTFSGNDATYNDDIRVTVYVTFRRQNGYTRTIKLTDFLHARP